MARGKRFSEFATGDVFESGGRTVTEADVVNFAGISGDYNPLHTDATFAAKTPFEQRVAHGMLAASISMVAFELRADQPLDASHGVACGSLLSVAGLLPACFAAILSLGALEPGAAWRVAARAGAAGLIGQAALARICDHHDVLHLVLFHLSGLLVVILVGSILPPVFGFVRARLR